MEWLIWVVRVLQSLATGIVPGNRNADNIDEALRDCTNLLYLNETVQTPGIKAALLKSFGFGQVGGEALLVHPQCLFKTLSSTELAAYCRRREHRQRITYGYMNEVLLGVRPLVQVKASPPYAAAQESKVYLNPLARTAYDPKLGSWAFGGRSGAESAVTAELAPALQALTAASVTDAGARGIGVDVQLIADVNGTHGEFLERNFTEQELAYCRQRPDPQSSLAGRWAAKEAIVKALCSYLTSRSPTTAPNWLGSAAAPLRAIEVLANASGAPVVNVSAVAGLPAGLAIRVSISHSGAYAVAVAAVSGSA